MNDISTYALLHLKYLKALPFPYLGPWPITSSLALKSIFHLGKKLGNIIYSDETAESSVSKAYDYTCTDRRVITKAALLMSKRLLSVETTNFPEGSTIDDLKDGDTAPPELVVHFFRSFVWWFQLKKVLRIS